MKALIIGATGATGKDVVEQLISNNQFESIILFVRRSIEYKHPKVAVQVVDFDHIEDWKDQLSGDVLYSCMGTTLKQAGGKKAQWKVDYDYQYNVAKAAQEAGVPCYALVSSVGANPQSSVFYLQMKGKLEEAVKKLNFKRTIIMRPPSLIRKDSTRWAESLSVSILKGLNKIGLLKKLKPVSTETVAKVMIEESIKNNDGTIIIEPSHLQKIE